MATVIARPNENFESLLKRFKRAVERSGVLAELKNKEHYEKPSQKKKRKRLAAIKREEKRLEKVGKVFKGNQNFRFSRDHKHKIPLKPKKPFNKPQYQKPPQQNRNPAPRK